MPSKIRRREYLLFGGGVVTGVTAGVAGYAGLDATLSDEPSGQAGEEESEPEPFVIIWNQANNDRTVTTIIRTQNEDTTLIQDTQSIPEGGEQEYTDLVAETSLAVTARTDEKERTYQWDSPDPENMLLAKLTEHNVEFEILR